MPRTSYFVDADAGDDSNDGLSTSTPWRTLAKATATLTAAFTLHLKGVFLERPVFSGMSDFEVRNWPYEDRFEINGYVPFSPADLTDSGSGYFTFTPADDAIIGQIGFNYVFAERFEDRPQAFVPRAASAAAAQGTPNRWFQDPTTKLVTFYPHADMVADIAAGTADLCWFRTGNGPALSGCSDAVYRDFVHYGWVGGDTTTGEPSINTGYGILVNAGSRDIVVRSGEIRGYGGHGIGAVNNQRGVIFRDLVVRTGRQGIGATTHVFHSNTASGGLDDQLTGNRCINVTLHIDGLLDVTGANITTGAINGFYAHGGSGILPSDVRFIRPHVVCYDDTPCNFMFGAGDTDATITDPLDAEQYPVLYDQFSHTNGQAQQINTTTKTQIAFRRGTFANLKNSAQTIETYSWNCSGTGSRFLFDACILAHSDDDADTGGLRMFNIANSPELRFLNCALVNSPSAAAHNMFFFNASATEARVLAYQTIILHRTTNARVVSGSGITVSADQLIFHHCVYYMITPSTGYNNTNSALNELAEWQAAIDPSGIYSTDPQLDTANLEHIVPADGGWQMATVDPAPPSQHAAIGINGRPYSGHYGPWQYGSADRHRSSMGIGLGIGVGSALDIQRSDGSIAG